MTIVVIRQLGGIGDVLSMSCVYPALRKKYPGAKIKLITTDQYSSGCLVELAEHNPFIDEILIFDPWEGTTPETSYVWAKEFGHCPDITKELVISKADLVIDLNCKCVLYEWAALETPEGIQKPRYQVWAEAAGVWPCAIEPVYEIKDTERLNASEEYEARGWSDSVPVIGVGIAACDQKRAMPTNMIREVCLGLKERGFRPVTIDAKWQFPEGDIEYIVGKKLSQLIPLMEKMHCVITADSGLLHMAGAIGTPVVGVFGPTDQSMRMGPYLGSAIDSRLLVPCAPCWYKYPCLAKNADPKNRFLCIQKIKPAMIVEEASRWVNWKNRTDTFSNLSPIQ